MKNCPKCNSINIQQLGDNLFCLDCDWDNLPKLEESKPCKPIIKGRSLNLIIIDDIDEPLVEHEEDIYNVIPALRPSTYQGLRRIAEINMNH